MPYAPKDPKTNAAGCAERIPFRPADFFSTLVKEMIAKPALSLRGLVIRMTSDMQNIAMSS